MTETIPVNRPRIAALPRRTPVAVVGTALMTLGIGVFLWLSDARAAQADGDSLPLLVSPGSAPATEPLREPAAQAQAAPAPAGLFAPTAPPVTLMASPAPRQVGFEPILSSLSQQPQQPAADPLRDRLRAPALIVDFAQARVPQGPGEAEMRSDSGSDRISVGVAPASPTAAPAVDRNLSATERFAARVGGEEVEVAVARQMGGLDRMVPQGAIIGAVMETALNSDTPGFARAVVQRDVRSFDGSTVLIPAGSRVIGQYKSGIAQGASRIFVLWTRLIRPDGVTIDLASPATDDLGRGGIGGKVNRHFLQRFGGAILTSVLSAGITAAAASASGGSTILVGSAGQASSLASQASESNDIPPTITSRQGASVRIFVARDLDFSRVGPVR